MDSRSPRDGRELEILGFYDPVAPRVEDQCRIKGDRVLDWVARGAQLSETARALCLRAGVELPAEETGTRRKRKTNPNQAKRKQERFMRLSKAKKERRLARLAAKKAAAAEAESSE